MRQGGTGLGLAIAHRHVEMMDGELALESTPGEGSRFFFTLPLPSGQALVEGEEGNDWSRVRHLVSGAAVRALIVDDVETNRDVLERMLVRVGVEVVMVESGAQALEQVRQQRPDIVFMDIRMPGMDGAETRQHLIEEHGVEAMKIVAVTASVFAHQRQHYEEVGFDDFIDKPVRAEWLYASMAELLGVEYEYTVSQVSAAVETDVGVEAGWQGISLPADLYAGFEAAVKMHSVTEINKNIDALDDLGEEGQRLAAHLRDLGRQYNMRAIQGILEEIGPS